jgi:hypothetical protein
MVVSWNLLHRPAEAPPLIGQGLEGIGRFRPCALLKSVSIDHGGEAIQAAMRSEHRGFPIAAFLQLTVAEHDIDMAR